MCQVGKDVPSADWAIDNESAGGEGRGDTGHSREPYHCPLLHQWTTRPWQGEAEIKMGTVEREKRKSLLFFKIITEHYAPIEVWKSSRLRYGFFEKTVWKM